MFENVLQTKCLQTERSKKNKREKMSETAEYPLVIFKCNDVDISSDIKRQIILQHVSVICQASF